MHLGEVAIDHLSRRAGESRVISSYPFPKWVVDKGLSLVLLVLLLPLYAIVLAAMALDMLLCRKDRGPWLYREGRVSRGREIDLLKFRTLRRDVLEAQAGEEAHARLHEADATNLTWAGRRLLKPWYLDELPQVWNVLRGDMSLVGPQPWPPSMVAKQVEDGFTYRIDFIAGWTGRRRCKRVSRNPPDTRSSTATTCLAAVLEVRSRSFEWTYRCSGGLSS